MGFELYNLVKVSPFVAPTPIFLPQISSHFKWQVIPVTPPLLSNSLYMANTVDYTYSRLYQFGCELGTRDLNLPGTQSSFVFLEFGIPKSITDGSGVTIIGVQEIYSTTFHSLSEIHDAVLGYAQGYYNCSYTDAFSHINIAIGTNNWDNKTTPEEYVTYTHGAAWGNLVLDVQGHLTSAQRNQITIAGASDMELGWNVPLDTRAWVDGYISSVYEPGSGVLADLYDIGNATGCPEDPTEYAPSQAYWYEACGAVEQPEWTAMDVVYLANRPGSKLMPMIYAHDEPVYSTTAGWLHAAQWQGLAMFNFDRYGYKLVFSGSTTEMTACNDHGIPLSDDQCATPEEGYTKLYSSLNTFPKTQTQSPLPWSTDMHWIPAP